MPPTTKKISALVDLAGGRKKKIIGESGKKEIMVRSQTLLIKLRVW